MSWNQSDEATNPVGLVRVMQQHHSAIESALCELAIYAHRGDAETTRTLFTILEEEVRDHLALEERQFLPLFAESNPVEEAGLREEHANVRCRLEKLGLAIELHELRPDMIDDFIALLRAHCARETHSLYAWVECRLTPTEKVTLTQWMLARLKERLARRASRPVGGLA
jgi:hypothetical protein